MKVSLFIPCYIDQLYPKVGLATYNVLKALNIEVDYPENQTCCGQPMFNSGCFSDAQKVAQHFIEVFSGSDLIVAPSGSCISMVKNHYKHLFEKDTAVLKKIPPLFELSEFLFDQVKINVDDLNPYFPYKVGIHASCHGLRELRTASCSEQNISSYSKLGSILSKVKGLDLIELKRKDECCGFGGTFAIDEADISCAMGIDRIEDHQNNGAHYITGGDVSCLMHLDSIIRYQKKNIKTIHFAEILSSGLQDY